MKERLLGRTAVSVDFAENDKISAKAKGIMLYLLSVPENKGVNEAEIIASMKDGRDSIRSGIKELEAHGFVRREIARKNNNVFDGYRYFVDDGYTQKVIHKKKVTTNE